SPALAAGRTRTGRVGLVAPPAPRPVTVAGHLIMQPSALRILGRAGSARNHSDGVEVAMTRESERSRTVITSPATDAATMNSASRCRPLVSAVRPKNPPAAVEAAIAPR